jgi:hypothetical protein
MNKKSRQRWIWRPGVQNRHIRNGAIAFGPKSLDMRHRHPVKDRMASLMLFFFGNASNHG